MPKNSQIHIFLETELFEKLKKEAIQLGIPLSELCRKKLEQPLSEEDHRLAMKLVLYAKENV